MPLATFLVTYHKDAGCQTSIFLGPWAEGREANFFQVPRLMLGTFTAPKIIIAHFQPTFFMSSHSLSWQNPWGGGGFYLVPQWKSNLG